MGPQQRPTLEQGDDRSAQSPGAFDPGVAALWHVSERCRDGCVSLSDSRCRSRSCFIAVWQERPGDRVHAPICSCRQELRFGRPVDDQLREKKDFARDGGVTRTGEVSLGRWLAPGHIKQIKDEGRGFSSRSTAYLIITQRVQIEHTFCDCSLCEPTCCHVLSMKQVRGLDSHGF